MMFGYDDYKTMFSLCNYLDLFYVCFNSPDNFHMFIF
jgi:hypothetical protein